MKKYNEYYCMISMLLFLFLLAACSNDSEDESAEDGLENDSVLELADSETDEMKQDETGNNSAEDVSENEEEGASENSEEDVSGNKEAGSSENSEENVSENGGDDASESAEENVSENEKDSILDGYSSEEIEYARVWLQIVGNQDIEELNVSHIAAGEQVNPYEDDSVGYPEDVITLQGKVMAEGTVTYSGNGDGTIKLYNVPSHWPSTEQIDETMEEYTWDILKNTELIYIETGNDEAIKELIDKAIRLQK